MSVVVDGRVLVDASRQRGLGTYMRNLVRGLAERDDVEPIVLAPGEPRLGDRARVVRLPRLPLRMVPSNRARLALERLATDAVLARATRRVGGDVYFTHGQDAPRRTDLPTVLTVQDLTTLVFRDPRHDADRRRWERMAGRVRAADAVVTPSESSRRQVIEHFGIDGARIHVVPLGVGAEFTPGTGRSTTAAPYIVYVTAYGPHKGFVEASRVAAALARLGYPHRLVIAGPMDAHLEAWARADIAAGGGDGSVDLRGYVEDLPALYRDAAVMIVPSRAEGFGLPAVEAMACGTPVVAFANTSLNEVVGEGGTLVPDGDSEAMVAAVRHLLDDDAARSAAAERARRWAPRFTWEACAAGHARLFHAVAGR